MLPVALYILCLEDFAGIVSFVREVIGVDPFNFISGCGSYSYAMVKHEFRELGAIDENNFRIDT